MDSAANLLQKAIEAITKMQAFPGVGKKTIAELNEYAEQIGVLQNSLTDIEERYDWSIGGGHDDDIRKSFEAWNAQTPGQSVDISTHAKNSPLLRGFYQKGVDFKRSRIFSPEEEKFSKDIGDNYDRLNNILTGIRSARELTTRENDTTKRFSALVQQRKGLFSTLNLLNPAIKIIAIQVKTKEGKWVPAKSEYMRESEQPTRAIFEIRDRNFYDLIFGHWMTCYVKNTIKDHLERNNKVFEIYANVSYSAPRDVIRSSSDFDVIGMSGESIFCIECKSGRFDPERGDITNIAERITDIRTVLKTFADSGQNINFSLVYNPFANKKDSILAPLKDDGIAVLKPSEVRGAVARLTQ